MNIKQTSKCTGCKYEEACQNYCNGMVEAAGEIWAFETYREKHPGGCIVDALKRGRPKRGLDKWVK